MKKQMPNRKETTHSAATAEDEDDEKEKGEKSSWPSERCHESSFQILSTFPPYVLGHAQPTLERGQPCGMK